MPPVEIEQAREIVLSECALLPDEPVPLHEALGRVLSAPVHAAAPVAPFASSAMDGFAVRAQDTVSEDGPAALRLVGESRAGHPATVALGAGEAIAISTGAMIPDGADAVLRIERADADGDVVLAVEQVVMGEDTRGVGEDLQAGQLALPAGTALGPAELGVLASIGCATPRCVRPPRVSLLSTGDELRLVGESLARGTLYDSNAHSLAALLAIAGAEVVRRDHVGDDPAATLESLRTAVEGVDVAVICGGMSVGRHDHVRPGLRQLGVEERFSGVRMRPGRPTWFGTLEGGTLEGGTLEGEAADGLPARRTLVFGLPGNPVSALVSCALLAVPALRSLLGADPLRARSHATLATDWQTDAGRADVVPCRLLLRDDGWVAHPPKAQGSHRLSTLVGVNALALLPAGSGPMRAGDRVTVEILNGWIGWGG